VREPYARVRSLRPRRNLRLSSIRLTNLAVFFQSLRIQMYTVRTIGLAGGDIKAIRQAAMDSPYADEGYPEADHLISKVFQAEYCLIPKLARLQFPSVALCNGVWMGGGVGFAGFLKRRVVTETTTFAMPECAIGAIRSRKDILRTQEPTFT
jgi:hypothetical protein